MKQIYVHDYFSGFRQLLGYSVIINHPQREIIEKRVKIIKFFDRYGPDVTKEAFAVGRSTVYEWKKKLRDSGSKLESLAPGNRKPKNKRNSLLEQSQTVIDFITNYRKEHPRVGKETITSVLNTYLKSQNIDKVSESIVGRLISRLKRKKPY